MGHQLSLARVVSGDAVVLDEEDVEALAMAAMWRNAMLYRDEGIKPPAATAALAWEVLDHDEREEWRAEVRAHIQAYLDLGRG